MKPKIKIYNDKREIVVLVLVLVILTELIWAHNYLSKSQPVVSSIPTPEAKTTTQATLKLSPSSETFAVGDNFEVQIVLEAEDTITTDGVDIALSFDPQKLEVLDVSSTDFYPQRLKIETDNEEGVIRFAVANSPDQGETRGGGVVGTITFQALQVGEAQVTFADATVATDGLNTLSQTSDGNYTIE